MNTKNGTAIFIAAAALLLASAAVAQAPQQSQTKSKDSQGSMPGMDMSDMQHETAEFPEAARTANDEMSGGSMDMNPHMFMTVLGPKLPGDDARAREILDILRRSVSKYRDYKVALADGYQIFLPKVPQQHYHFTSYRNAFAAAFVFNPAHPTSLLYKKTGDGYELEGAMFTAPKNATESQLNDRVPLSVARWHEHVNLCLPPQGTSPQQVNWKQFGLGGSIASKDACDKAGGRWMKQIFGWMVHVYPFESDPDKVWAH
ncbi:MAG TPA: hypothetical protein VJO53_04640 [Candidatus Acidoferrales bacterium]|nr:hypothetical protein [Candidatus Acidoferrales bacterium]